MRRQLAAAKLCFVCRQGAGVVCPLLCCIAGKCALKCKCHSMGEEQGSFRQPGQRQQSVCLGRGKAQGRV